MIAIIIQARMGSTRHPGKVLTLLGGKPVLFHVVERCRKAVKADLVVVATSDTPADDPIADFCAKQAIPCIRGSLDDVLARYYHAAKELHTDTIVRVTADCPLIAPELIDSAITAFEEAGADYASNIIPEPRRLIRGLDVEVFSLAALSIAHKRARDFYEREHVTPYMRKNVSKKFVVVAVPFPELYARPFRLTLDYPEDLLLMEKIYEALWRKDAFLETSRAISFLEEHPEIARINRDCIQKI